MRFFGKSAILAAICAVLLGAGAIADTPGSYTGRVAGLEQFDASGPIGAATHTHNTGGGGTCTETITFSYNGIAGDNAFSTGLHRYPPFTPGYDYLTHLYLTVDDAAGAPIDEGIWTEDDGNEIPGLIEGVLPAMSKRGTISGACGDWLLKVVAHRGIGEYTISVA